ncbi:hypothetical protein [Arthrobacter sp. H14-L1]|uniref:hypothetical protein n=1 Tax=Arthrobacter sp. H14-L1 TaxID=2996697 RepID=UPI003B63BC89
MDKTHSRGPGGRPFLVRVEVADGTVTDHAVSAVIDASGTWAQPNPLGQAGLVARGEAQGIERGLITGPLPDVTGTDRARFAGRHVLVIGAGHSAANILISLGQLAKNEQGTRVSWAVRGADPSRIYGGGDVDALPARGRLGIRLRGLVADGYIELHTCFTTISFAVGDGLAVTGASPDGPVTLAVDF